MRIDITHQTTFNLQKLYKTKRQTAKNSGHLWRPKRTFHVNAMDGTVYSIHHHHHHHHHHRHLCWFTIIAY